MGVQLSYKFMWFDVFIASSLLPLYHSLGLHMPWGRSEMPRDPTSWAAALGESPLQLFTPHRESHQDV